MPLAVGVGEIAELTTGLALVAALVQRPTATGAAFLLMFIGQLAVDGEKSRKERDLLQKIA